MSVKNSLGAWRAVRLAMLAAVVGVLGACDGIDIKPTTTPLTVPTQEMRDDQPGLLSGPDGDFVIYERK
jgi:hypothetical protein